MTRAPAIGFSRWLTIPEMGGAGGEASRGDGEGEASAHPPEKNSGKSEASAADGRRLIAEPRRVPGQVYDFPDVNSHPPREALKVATKRWKKPGIPGPSGCS